MRLQSDHVELQLAHSRLLNNLLGFTTSNFNTIDHEANQASHDSNDDTISIQTSNGLEPTGNGLRLMFNDANQTTPNIQLAPLLEEAFTLRETLLNCPHDSIEATLKALRLGDGYISARIRLTFLSPSLIKKILSGDIPNTLSPTRLSEASKNLPVKWTEQDQFINALAR